MSGVESSILMWMLDANFSQILGTLPKIVGEISRRLAGEVSRLSTKLTVTPVKTDEDRDEVFVNVGERQ